MPPNPLLHTDESLTVLPRLSVSTSLSHFTAVPPCAVEQQIFMPHTKETNDMRPFNNQIVLSLFLLATGCYSGPDPKQWPPDSQVQSSITGFQPSTNLSFDSWDLIYVSKEDMTNIRVQTTLGVCRTTHPFL